MRVVFLNLGPPSKVSNPEANADISAILRTEPDLLLGCEAYGRGPLPSGSKLGYDKLRDRSNGGRSNMYAYVKGDDLPAVSWEDMNTKFAREPGKSGLHPARSFFKFNFRRVQIIGAHHPPGWPGTDHARAEHLIELRRAFAPWTREATWQAASQRTRDQAKNKARALFWDRNMDMRAFRKFADSCDAGAIGEAVDSLMYRNLVEIDPHYTRVFDGHRIHTDHKKGAFVVTFKVRK